MSTTENTLNEKIKKSYTGDLGLVILVLILCLFGIIMVFSASYYVSINEDGNPYSYLKKQLMWFGMGLVTMLIFSRIDYHIWGKFWVLFYLIGLALLGALFIPHVGININGATRWIGVGPITIMPGEIAKITLIFYISGLLAKSPNLVKDIWGVLGIVGVTGVYAALIMKQPNMSTAATIVLMAGGMLLVAGTKMWQLFALGGLAIAGGVALVMTSEYRYDEGRDE
ncbi:MAG: FtsW/RodA/SpoVE family cell cycle protein, partial [Firmicutes bacterium]|nr:FtsW/RodA/SpoVE family cell cycle protein [Bacillota bacterium]